MQWTVIWIFEKAATVVKTFPSRRLAAAVVNHYFLDHKGCNVARDDNYCTYTIR